MQPALPLKNVNRCKGGSGRILFVDDEPAIVKMGQEMLERLGYHVVGVTNAAVAYEVLRAAPDQYDLLITDKTMRGMNGFELVASVRRIRPELPVMVLTGFSDAQDPTHVQRLGIQELVMKPILLPDLAEKIRRLLNLDAAHNPHAQPDEKNYRAS
jgi:two-component system cell cycle sensor histidine kinase/response regulator CckA